MEGEWRKLWTFDLICKSVGWDWGASGIVLIIKNQQGRHSPTFTAEIPELISQCSIEMGLGACKSYFCGIHHFRFWYKLGLSQDIGGDWVKQQICELNPKFAFTNPHVQVTSFDQINDSLTQINTLKNAERLKLLNLKQYARTNYAL